jgi:hypothetical protein
MLPRPLSEPGPLLAYLTQLRKIDSAKADKVQAMVRLALGTEGGAILLELLEVSTLLSQQPVLGDDRALAARNAQAFIASDLRRIMSNETEELLQRQTDAASARRDLARPRRTGG